MNAKEASVPSTAKRLPRCSCCGAILQMMSDGVRATIRGPQQTPPNNAIVCVESDCPASILFSRA